MQRYTDMLEHAPEAPPAPPQEPGDIGRAVKALNPDLRYRTDGDTVAVRSATGGQVTFDVQARAFTFHLERATGSGVMREGVDPTRWIVELFARYDG